MKLLCEGCEQLLPVSGFRVEGGAVVCVCPACGRSHRLESAAPATAPESHPAPQRDEPADPLAAPEGVCPKCLTPRAELAEECGRCGLRFASARPEYYAPSPALASAFRAALARWEVPTTHASLLRVALGRSELSALARLYRLRLTRDPADLPAKEALDRLVEHAASEALTPEAPRPKRIRKKQVRAAFAAFLLLAVLGMFALYGRMH